MIEISVLSLFAVSLVICIGYDISILAALLVIAGVVLAILLLPGQQAQPAGNPERAELYWNIDRVFYTENSTTGLSTREPDADGLYHIRVAIDGEQKELLATDKKLINYMDSMEVFGIVTDADGLVVEVIPAKNLATELAIGYFVRRAEGDTVVVNSSKTMNGVEETLTLAALTGVYDVTPDAEVIGQPGQCAPLDKVHIYSNDNGVITHVFIAEHAQTADVYYRVGYHYEWYEKHTIRVPDENGVYTVLSEVLEQAENHKNDFRLDENDIDAVTVRDNAARVAARKVISSMKCRQGI